MRVFLSMASLLTPLGNRHDYPRVFAPRPEQKSIATVEVNRAVKRKKI
jgi:hypothetical protein